MSQLHNMWTTLIDVQIIERQSHGSWWEITSESLYESFHNSHVLVKQEQELRKSWRELGSESLYVTLELMRDYKWKFVSVRVFSTLMSWSNENKSCVLISLEKREFIWEFCQLMSVLRSESLYESLVNSCPGQTRTRVAWELMRVEKREFAWEFGHESLHENFLNSCPCSNENKSCMKTNSLSQAQDRRRWPWTYWNFEAWEAFNILFRD